MLDKVREMNKVALIWILLWIIIFLFDRNKWMTQRLCSLGVSIVGKEYYRFFGGLLLHMNLLHIWANVMGMYYVCYFLNGKVSVGKLLIFSIVAGTIATIIYATFRPQSTMVGGSPMVFALIGLIIVLQLKHPELPRFRWKSQCGQWIVGYATLGNIPILTDDFSAFFVHMLGLGVGMVLGYFAV